MRPALGGSGVADTLGGWSLAMSAPDKYATPRDVTHAALPWIAAPVPGTVAEALKTAGQWDFDRPLDFDAYDWWYRCEFDRAASEDAECLHFEGLATLADVWLNGESILNADNMFRDYRVDVTDRLRDRNSLLICFRSLEAALAKKRSRPRWKTKLVSQQQLRWFRTTLLGRIPGWSPPVAPVGPWRAVSLERRSTGTLAEIDLRAWLDGAAGLVEFSCVLCARADVRVSGDFAIGDASATLRVEPTNSGYTLTALLRLEDVAVWWPHTHGHPTLHPWVVRVDVDGRQMRHEGPPIGFRRVEARRDRAGFALDVNGVPVFCRGACWTVNDIVSLGGSPADTAQALTLMRDAGANMIRVGGTMLYEGDEFYRRCDELGILVWQDFMFANMDYPADDPSFLNSVQIEVTQQLRRLRRHPCLATYCGNSEVEQQAAMLGVEREAWRNRLFSQVIPDLCAQWHPDVPFVPSSPSGGDLPFQVGEGIAHYYGVGAYLRPIADVRRANVRFTSECLGFANVPEPDLVDSLTHGERGAAHGPRWKSRTPRDTGCGWDFEDVRDHYLGQLFSVDPVRLRSVDPDRYLRLGRIATGEVMARVFAEWRSTHSSCAGGIVWFLKDLWPGAGWGILDSRGVPKACFQYLRRAWQPRAVVITDEGLDGLDVHVINETDRRLSASLELTLLHRGRTVVARARRPCSVDARSVARYRAEAIFDRFLDVSGAYAFGPPAHDVLAATLSGQTGEALGEAFWIRDAAVVASEGGAAVVAEAQPTDGAAFVLSLTSECFLFAAHVDAPGFRPDDDYFCVMPGRTKTVRLEPLPGPRGPIAAWVEALNLDGAIAVEVKTPRKLVTS